MRHRSEEYDIQIIKSARKSMSIEIKPDLSIIVRTPRHMSKARALRFVEEKQDWINRHIDTIKREHEKIETLPLLTELEHKQLKDKARDYLPGRAGYYAKKLGVSYGRITIRCQKTRWGSCSAKGNLNFNYLLMLTPPEVIDYVVVHELCHRLEMNHSRRFWELVESVMEDYKEPRAYLKKYGAVLMHRAGY
ncbi:MAG: M48 family metallopeptidase [Eubacterium sp.]|nr:M48 family metallopeptidase [Eubacterium sp.]